MRTIKTLISHLTVDDLVTWCAIALIATVTLGKITAVAACHLIH